MSLVMQMFVRGLGELMRRWRSTRGVTLVEYALVTSLLVVASLGAIEYLNNESKKETQEQATCIAMRPPPPDCQIPTAATTTTAPDPDAPPPPEPPPEPPPPDPPPPPSTAEASDPGRVDPIGTNVWLITGPTILVETGDDVPFPVSGAVIRFNLEVQDPTTGEWVVVATATCTTNSTGTCANPPEFTWDNNLYVPPVLHARVVVDDIQSDPAVSSYPAPSEHVLA